MTIYDMTVADMEALLERIAGGESTPDDADTIIELFSKVSSGRDWMHMAHGMDIWNKVIWARSNERRGL